LVSTLGEPFLPGCPPHWAHRPDDRSPSIAPATCRSASTGGFRDLLEGVLNEVLPALAPPRRRALKVALLLEEAQETLDPRGVGVATRSAPELLAEAQPLLVALDDVQWLDLCSTDALSFAMRARRRRCAFCSCGAPRRPTVRLSSQPFLRRPSSVFMSAP
jgi:hypothetical protein